MDVILVAALLTWGTIPSALLAAPNPNSAAAQRIYARKAQAQINDLAAKFHRVERRLPHLERSARKECEESLRHLWSKERAARQTLQELRNAAPAGWQALRRKEDALLIRLQKSYQYLLNHYFR
jgi:hypothetical protein